MGHGLRGALAATAIAAALIAPGVAHAATGLSGRCGMHIGSLIRRNQEGSTWNMRIGPRDDHLGVQRPTTCRGLVRVHRKGQIGQVGALAWQTYSLNGFNRHAALLVNSSLTVVGCGGVARIMVGAIGAFVSGATDGIAFPATAVVAGSIGCGEGAHALVNLIPDGPNTLDKVRMVK
jgi:hypothetical protein